MPAPPIASNAGVASPARPATVPVRAPWLLAGLIALAAATRIPLVGASWGEADGARYLLGLHQWLAHGPGAPMIYAKVLSPGYYALAAALVHLFHASPARVLDLLSVLAAILTAPLLYWIGARLASRAVAAAGAALFLLAPAVWWLGIEPHPQGLSFLFFLAALACELRALAHPRRRWLVLGAAALGGGLLCKNDLVLLCGIFPALAWNRELRLRRVAESLALVAGGAAVFWLARPFLLGTSFARAGAQTTAALAEFWQLPHGVQWIKQLLPMLTAPGLATLGVTVIGLAVGLGHAGWRRRWLLPLLAWVAPGTLFWLMVRGNNARHMAPFILLPLWAALEAMRALMPRAHRPWRLLALVALIAVLNLALPPANSNTTLFPSADVPASQRDLALRMRQLAAWERATLALRPCYLGNGTLPYLEMALVDRGTSLDAARFFEVNSPADYRRAAQSCVPALSLEYGPHGLHRQFLGAEWRTLPFRNRFYPAGR